ncbi:hypothetical protein B0H13DRAFT_2411530 [Mycena leptocephala]|nr:hypothetical protein B0H13DRAFT_2411530 [Mycena leptocephala]
MSIPETTGNTFLLAHARSIPPGVRNPFALAAIPINLERKPAKNMDPRVLAGDSVDSRIGLLVDNKSICEDSNPTGSEAPSGVLIHDAPLAGLAFADSPPLDGSLTIAQIYDWHFQNTPLHRLFVYARVDESVKEICWPEAVQAIYTGAHIPRKRFEWTPGMREMPVVAILASSDTIPYFILVMSCLRANYVPFPISPRNSPSAVANLISKAGVRHLLIGHGPAMAHLAEDAIGILKEEYSTTAVPDVSYVPSFEDLFISASDTRPTPEDLPFEYHGPDAAACIIHSSGSTAFPKPICWTNHHTSQTALIPWFGERDLTGQIFSLHSMPMYHGLFHRTLFVPTNRNLGANILCIFYDMFTCTYTAKMTVRRQAVIADYEDEIATLYETVEQTATLNIPSLVEWDAASTLDFVRNAVHNIMANDLGDDEDIFQHGCDSLQATWIRNGLLGALRDLAQLDRRRDTGNFVYEYPTISHLAAFVFGMASGQHKEETSVETKSNIMREMVKNYVQDFPTHPESDSSPAAKVVLLGCYLLSLLLADDSVVRVYAINRSSPQQPDLRDRQAHALVERGLDVGILDSSKTSLLTGDVSRPGFGLATPVYQQASKFPVSLPSDIGLIRVIAWPVDFNLALRSFEPNIKGLRNLLDFSLDSPFMEPRSAQVQNGYTESKWISEEILAQAAESTPAKPLIIRVGQQSGGINGTWNISEWVPALVQSAQFIRCIPDDSRDVTWLPVHIAAAAIIDFLETAPGTQIVHLINPRPGTWSTLANIIAADRDIPLVPYTEWLSQLENVAQKQTQEDSKSFRALRLLPFFRSQNHQTAREAFGFPRLDAANATSASKSLRSPGCQLGEKDVKEWIGYWREAGFI